MSDPAPTNPATTLAHPLPVPPHGDRGWWGHVRDWQQHVRAGRIGAGAGMEPALLEQIRHNEAVLLGATPSFPAAGPARGRGRGRG